jgi:hypothetical protein
MRRFHGLHNFALKTATTLRHSFAQTSRHRGFLSAAIAPTAPCGFAGHFNHRNDSQFPEPTTDQVFSYWRHGAYYTPEMVSA